MNFKYCFFPFMTIAITTTATKTNIFFKHLTNLCSINFQLFTYCLHRVQFIYGCGMSINVSDIGVDTFKSPCLSFQCVCERYVFARARVCVCVSVYLSTNNTKNRCFPSLLSAIFHNSTAMSFKFKVNNIFDHRFQLTTYRPTVVLSKDSNYSRNIQCIFFPLKLRICHVW